MLSRRSPARLKVAALVAATLVVGTVQVADSAAHAHAEVTSGASGGADFWLGFPHNHSGTPALTLFIAGSTATTGTVTVPGIGFTSSFSVTPGSTASVSIPVGAQMSPGMVEDKGIHVTAGAEVTVYGLNHIQYSSDGYLALSTASLGTDYEVLGTPNAAGASQAAVVATMDATTVSITPTAPLTGGQPANTPFQLQLNAGQTYELDASSGDLSGSTISSDHPLAVYGGNVCADVPLSATACDHVVEEMPPTQSWGESFLTVPLKTRDGGDTFRILARRDATTVKINGTAVAVLNAGEVYQQTVVGRSAITADQPILVAQYANGTSYDGVTGDPFEMLVVPTEQFLSQYTVFNPPDGFTGHYLNVVAPTVSLSSITLDGTPVPTSSFNRIGTSDYSGAQLTVAPGSHHLEANAAFEVYVYGFAWADSYGWPGGTTGAPTPPDSSSSLGGGLAVPNKPTCDATPNPVNCASGNFWHTFTDINVPGRGPGLTASRTYNAQAAAVTGAFGYGWSWNYGASLHVNTDQTVTITLADGSQVTGYPGVGSTYRMPTWSLSTLSQAQDGTWLLTRRGQQRITFDAAGDLTSIRDLNGDGPSLAYTNGRLAAITDDSGHSIAVTTDAAGHITALTDPANKVTHFDYDAAGNLSHATDPTGAQWTFDYDAAHRMTAMTDPRGNTVNNTYDTQSRVLTQTDALTRRWQFTYTGDNYSADGGTTAITDPAGNHTVEHYLNGELQSVTRGQGTSAASTTSFDYDPTTLGRTTTIDPDGKTWHATFDARGNQLTSTDPLGRTTRWTYNALNEPLATTDAANNVTSDVYDANGNLTSTTAPTAAGTATTTYHHDDATHPSDVTSVTDPDGKTWHYDHDAAGNVTSATDPVGNQTTYGYDSLGRKTSMTTPRGNVAGATPADYRTTYGYDDAGHLTDTTDPLGDHTHVVYDTNGNPTDVTDPRGKVTHTVFDADNEKTKSTRADATTMSWEYDADGNIHSVTNGNGKTTTYDHDALNRITTVTAPLNRVTRYTYDPAGHVLTVTDPSDVTTTFTYDDAGQKLSQSRPLNTTDVAKLSYTYGDPAHPNLPTIVTDPNQNNWTTSYDPAGQVLTSTDPLGDTTSYTYDAAGRKTTMVSPRGNTAGATAADYTTAYGYDDAGALTSVTDPNGHTTGYGYDPDHHQTTLAQPITASTGVVTKTDYDHAGRVVAVTRGVGTAAAATSRYTYDANGNQLTQTDPGNQQTTYTYDAMNRVDTITDPLAHQDSYTYDGDGNLATLTQPGALVTSYGYDAADENTSISYSDTKTPNVAYTYTPLGQRSSMTDGTGTSTYGYDQLGRLTSTTNGAGAGVHYGYDLNGNNTSITYPGATSQVVNRGYDTANRLTSVTDWLHNKTTLTPDADGNMTTVAYGNGVTDSQSFDHAGKLTAITLTKPGGAALGSFTYTRDASNKITSDTPTGGASTTADTYSYDPLNRLTADAKTGQSTTNFTYDASDNILTTGTWTLTYGSGSGSSSGSELSKMAYTALNASGNISYDARGNRLNSVNAPGLGNTAYAYDQANRPTRVTSDYLVPGDGYTYDGDGLRASLTTGLNKTTPFTWQTNTSLPLLLSDGTNSYLYDDNGLPLEHIATSNSVVTYYQHDQYGSTRYLTDNTGAQVATYNYDPQGTVHNGTNTAGISTNLLWNGQWRDADTGLYYLRARYYDPATAQFLSVDPLAELTQQRYEYAGDDPLNSSDRTGLNTIANGGSSLCNPRIPLWGMPLLGDPGTYGIGLLPPLVPDPILSGPAMPPTGNCDGNGSVGTDPAAIRRCEVSVDCAYAGGMPSTQCAYYYNPPGCEQLHACPFGPEGRCTTGLEPVCVPLGIGPDVYAEWWQQQIRTTSDGKTQFWAVRVPHISVKSVIETGGGCAAGAGVGEWAGDTFLFWLDWTGVPEGLSPTVGCAIGGILGNTKAGALLDAAGQATNQ